MIVSWASGSRLSTNIEHLWGKSEHAAGTMKHKLKQQPTSQESLMKIIYSNINW